MVWDEHEDQPVESQPGGEGWMDPVLRKEMAAQQRLDLAAEILRDAKASLERCEASRLRSRKFYRQLNLLQLVTLGIMIGVVIYRLVVPCPK